MAFCLKILDVELGDHFLKDFHKTSLLYLKVIDLHCK